MINQDYLPITDAGAQCSDIHYDANEACTAAMYMDDGDKIATISKPKPVRERKQYIDKRLAGEITLKLIARYEDLECDFAELLSDKYKCLAEAINPDRYGVQRGPAQQAYYIADAACKRVQEKLDVFLAELASCIAEPLQYCFGGHIVDHITADNIREYGTPNWRRVEEVLPTLDITALCRMEALLKQERAICKWG